MSDPRIIAVKLDERTILWRNADIEQERRIAIFDLLENNHFRPLRDRADDYAGPYRVTLRVEEGRLAIDIGHEDETSLDTVVLPLTPFRRTIRNYFAICDSYYKAIRSATPAQIETVDMARRSLHNDGAEMLKERLDDKIEVDFDTARRLFTLICVLHIRGSLFMSIMSDRWIRERATKDAMIEPFVESQRRDGCISYGLSSYGYDARVSDEFKIFTNVDNAIVDPKDFAHNSFVDRKTNVCIIPPNSFALARTVEYFRVPSDVLVICLGKSTYARCGIIVNVTPLEPGWEGHVTLEFSNTTPLPAKVYANEGACQFLFLQGNEPCEVTYADRAGKYMGQKGVTLPKL